MSSPATFSELSPLVIDAIVTDAEFRLVAEAVRLLSAALSEAAGRPCAVELHRWEALCSAELARCGASAGIYRPGPRLVLLSLQPDVAQTAPRLEVADARRSWDALLPPLQAGGATAIFLLTVFRRLPGPIPHRYLGSEESLGERIRRFNLLAAELSHDHAVWVLDIDRAFADIGSASLRTDYRLAGEPATTAGGQFIAATLLRVGLDDYFPVEFQTQALAGLEAARDALDWLGLCRYREQLAAFHWRLQALHGAAWERQPGSVQRLGEFLLERAEKLQGVAPLGTQALHRDFIAALRETGRAQLDLHAALERHDAAGIRQALQRLQAANDCLATFWDAWRALEPSAPE